MLPLPTLAYQRINKRRFDGPPSFSSLVTSSHLTPTSAAYISFFEQKSLRAVVSDVTFLRKQRGDVMVVGGAWWRAHGYAC